MMGPTAAEQLASLPAHVAAMLDPGLYPHAVTSVELRETHVPWLLFAGPRVYKVKKSLDLGYLDFRSPAARHQACQDELWLNRRLTEDVHLDVQPISHHEGATTLSDDAYLVDWCVVMRRVPEEHRLDVLADAGQMTTHLVARVARTLAAFHAAADRAPPPLSDHGRLPSVRHTWKENHEQVGPFVGRSISEQGFGDIAAWVTEVMDRLGPVFEARADDGHVVDGHGDVRAEAVFFEAERVQVLDCLESSERLRHGDVAADWRSC